MRLISHAEVRDAAARVMQDQDTWRDGPAAIGAMVKILTGFTPARGETVQINGQQLTIVFVTNDGEMIIVEDLNGRQDVYESRADFLDDVEL